jgi:hypothetical protein
MQNPRASEFLYGLTEAVPRYRARASNSFAA